MSLIGFSAELTGYVVWFVAAWALLNRTVTILARFEDERRRRRNARRFAAWKPPPRHTADPGHDVTRVLPGIQRPKGP
jgi:hypothetical protein